MTSTFSLEYLIAGLTRRLRAKGYRGAYAHLSVAPVATVEAENDPKPEVEIALSIRPGNAYGKNPDFLGRVFWTGREDAAFPSVAHMADAAEIFIDELPERAPQPSITEAAE